MGNYVLVGRICWKKSRIVSGFRSYLQTRTGPGRTKDNKDTTLSISPREYPTDKRGGREGGGRGEWIITL